MDGNKKNKQTKKDRMSDEMLIERVEERSEEIEGEQLPTQPGREKDMEVKPLYEDDFAGAGRLKDKVAIVTGGDSGIGRAVALAYAQEGAKVVIVYLEENEDATMTQRKIEESGGKGMIIAGDVGEPNFCKKVVRYTLNRFGQIDILVNNAGEQHPQKDILDITAEQLEKTFRTNIFSMFYMVQAALPHLKENACIIPRLLPLMKEMRICWIIPRQRALLPPLHARWRKISAKRKYA